MVAALQGSAAAQTISYFTTGSGRSACSAYLASYQGLQLNTKETMTRQRVFVSQNTEYDQWIFGFFSAMNFTSAQNGNAHPDIKVRNVEILSFVRDFCSTHPTSTIMEATQKFINARWSASSATTAPANGGDQPPPAVTGANSAFVLVTFQPNASEDDVNTLLQAYKLKIAGGPNPDGSIRLQLSAPLPADQMQLFLDSMNSQKAIVKKAVAG